MAWTPIPNPYGKYVYEDPNDYTSADPELVKHALDQAGLGDASSGILSNWSNMMGLGSVSPSNATNGKSSTPPPSKPPVDFRSLVENDPYYQQEKQAAAAADVSDSAHRAAQIKQAFINWGIMPDLTKTAQELGISEETLGYLKADIDPQTGQFAQQNEAQGLSQHARLDKANQQNIDAIRNSLASRGMYQSGELPYGLENNAQQYKQASTDALKNVLGVVEDVSNRYASGKASRAHDLGTAQTDAAGRVLQQIGSTDTSGSTNPAGSTTTGPAHFNVPASAKTFWDVNTGSTMDAINAAKQNGGGVVIRPDDPEAWTKANAAAEAGVPVSIQVNGSGDDTAQTLAARVQQFQQAYPGASFTLDLESPNFRDMTPGKMEAYAQAVQQVAPNTPITITTEGVSDFNYAAWASNPNVTFAPQCYWGDMTPRNVQQIVNLLTAQGIPANRIVPVVAPGQDLGGYTGPVSVYGAPQGQAPATQPTSTPSAPPAYSADPGVAAAQQNAVQSAPNYSPETVQAILQAVQQAYTNPYMDTTYKSGGMY